MSEPKTRSQSADDALEQFLRFDALGLRQKSKQAVLKLVEAVSSLEAKTVWTHNYLEQLPLNGSGRIRHEIYEDIVFPALQSGFDRGEAEASYLLGKYAQNLYARPALREQMEQRSEVDFFRLAFQGAPSSEKYRRAYLSSLMNSLRQDFHEWPTGILLDPAKPWRVALMDLKEELSIALSLDREGQFVALLGKWSEITEQYEKRLARREEHP
ncbi:hypothetical protein N6L27_12135 [Leisingera sp. SS27]|uniref:hypothetical protein n=1 Tax=Leisingera sp. SS27 TaxID=2979462 RepID=UPI00232F176E|nr:hypothetical protein [Leisingera sp. SS27]MDC0658751.1 hypothetical protein [Leisingera sp. SS27]